MPLIPLVGVACFLAFYFSAAAIYPGGTEGDHQSAGYSHLWNFWCDLLHPVSYSGVMNGGRPFALAGTIALPLSLIPLWLLAPLLFLRRSALDPFVRAAGVLAMVLASLVWTPFHDLSIEGSSLFGFGAFIAAELGFLRAGRRRLFAVGIAPVLFGAATFLMWKTGAGAVAIPLVQKAAYATFLVWIVVVSRSLQGQGRSLQPA
jgi:hypothetical protein